MQHMTSLSCVTTNGQPSIASSAVAGKNHKLRASSSSSATDSAAEGAAATNAGADGDAARCCCAAKKSPFPFERVLVPDGHAASTSTAARDSDVNECCSDARVESQLYKLPAPVVAEGGTCPSCTQML